jgi:hypothetical protein
MRLDARFVRLAMALHQSFPAIWHLILWQDEEDMSGLLSPNPYPKGTTSPKRFIAYFEAKIKTLENLGLTT